MVGLNMSFKTVSLPLNILQKIYKVRDRQITFTKVKVEFPYFLVLNNSVKATYIDNIWEIRIYKFETQNSVDNIFKIY